MSDLTVRLEALFRRYAANYDPHRSAATLSRMVAQFRKDFRLLIAEYGQAAVDAALDELPDAAWPSVYLH
jgi:hypothetical protein